ncbi:MAG: acylglycerol kinase family protein, partial [Clostridia bacterium]|nr:acylglycerol kinase family protein [Clostridia bacterium]
MRVMNDEKKCLLVVNPVAGRKSIQKNIPQIVRIFMDTGYLVTTTVTAAKGEAEALTREYAASHDLVVAAGGDGTLNEVVAGLARAGITVPVGYIPCGSTNEFATAQ